MNWTSPRSHSEPATPSQVVSLCFVQCVSSVLFNADVKTPKEGAVYSWNDGRVSDIIKSYLLANNIRIPTSDLETATVAAYLLRMHVDEHDPMANAVARQMMDGTTLIVPLF